MFQIALNRIEQSFLFKSTKMSLQYDNDENLIKVFFITQKMLDKIDKTFSKSNCYSIYVERKTFFTR